MKISSLIQYALCASVAVAILAGCSSATSQSPFAPSGAVQQNIAQLHLNPPPFGRPPSLAIGVLKSARPDHGPSWMAPAAKRKDLLYVSDQGTADVYVYSYPRGRLMGTLTGFEDPQGLCVDKAGNVFIVNQGTSNILEYAHGGTSPIATLSDSGYFPVGCSVDPMTGNLAVANLESATGGYQGNVSIYADAQGTPTTYTDPNIYYFLFCGYDNKGNLYADGETAASQSNTFAFGKLPRRSSTFTNILLDQTIYYPGGVQWDGNHVAVGDQDVNAIYQFTISGTVGTKVGSTQLNGASTVVQFWIHREKVIGPDINSANVMFWNYPAGGTATKTITGLSEPFGSTVSEVKK
jgi:hypothetical protein